MRSKFVAIAAVCGLALAARAEDTKPPSISDVKASAKGGKVTVEARITDETGVLSAICHHRTPGVAGGAVDDSPMTKDDYDDVFKVSFAGTADSEYWIESSDLLGNGPSVYGTQGKPYTANGKPSTGKTAVADAQPPPPKEETHKRPPRSHTTKTAKASGPPVIEHRKPSTQPPEGKDFTLRMKIHSDSPVAVSLLLMRQQGMSGLNNVKLNHGDGDSYDGTIPAAQAKGTVEYFIVAKNEAGQVTRLGDGDAKTPFVVNFKTGAAAAAKAFAGPYVFTDNPPYRVPPGKAIVLRAQVVPSADDGTLPDRVVLLWRGNDAQDQMADMQADATGGYGGFKVELPAQHDEGAVFYQFVACDSSGNKCGIDTGSKRKWHATAVAAQPGAAPPMQPDAASSRAPSSLPE
jgi:hypothetical protein